MARFFVSVIFIGLFNLFIDLKINLYEPKPELTVLLIIVVSKTNRLNEEVAVIWSQTLKYRSTSKIVEWEKKKRAKRTKNVLQCPMC